MSDKFIMPDWAPAPETADWSPAPEDLTPLGTMLLESWAFIHINNTHLTPDDLEIDFDGIPIADIIPQILESIKLIREHLESPNFDSSDHELQIGDYTTIYRVPGYEGILFMVESKEMSPQDNIYISGLQGEDWREIIGDWVEVEEEKPMKISPLKEVNGLLTYKEWLYIESKDTTPTPALYREYIEDYLEAELNKRLGFKWDMEYGPSDRDYRALAIALTEFQSKIIWETAE